MTAPASSTAPAILVRHIGRDCRTGRDCRIGRDSRIGRNCRIRAGSSYGCSAGSRCRHRWRGRCR
ncbi:hypothetical protein [Streptomyces mooreae]|uniref:hypothetical protein n=1 Tax=Streptomyces mooreae TaxID=3075523 RepID=UPI00374E1075